MRGRVWSGAIEEEAEMDQQTEEMAWQIKMLRNYMRMFTMYVCTQQIPECSTEQLLLPWSDSYACRLNACQ